MQNLLVVHEVAPIKVFGRKIGKKKKNCVHALRIYNKFMQPERSKNGIFNISLRHSKVATLSL